MITALLVAVGVVLLFVGFVTGYRVASSVVQARVDSALWAMARQANASETTDAINRIVEQAKKPGRPGSAS